MSGSLIPAALIFSLNIASIIQGLLCLCTTFLIFCSSSITNAIGNLIGTASQVALVVENQPANAGDTGDVGSVPGSRRSPGGGHGNPLQCSCLENPMDRKAWWATVHRVAKSQTRLSNYYIYILYWTIQLVF